MAKYTKEVILQMAEEEDVEFIRLQFTDMFGMMKNMAITAGQLEKALNNQCVFDGSSFEGFVTIEEADMFLHPDRHLCNTSVASAARKGCKIDL